MVDDKKEFMGSVFKTFDIKLSTLPERIAFQKTVYLLQNLGSGTNFDFVWHNFGPYSQEVANLGFGLDKTKILEFKILNDSSALKFKQLKNGEEGNSKFLEMMSDIVFLKKLSKIEDKEILFKKLVEHRSYLEDRNLFDLSIQRLTNFNLI